MEWALPHVVVSKTRVVSLQLISGVACKTRLRREYITTTLDKLDRFVGREKFGSFFCLFVYKSLYPPSYIANLLRLSVSIGYPIAISVS